MAVVVYNNGITEDYRPNNLVFTEDEIVSLFSECDHIKTLRIPHLVNTWCIFGEGNSDPTDFNRIVSDIVRESIFSHALFVHDSEINPKWKATDNILYKGYEEFIVMMKKIIDDVALNILNEFSQTEEYTSKVGHLPMLSTIGLTEDKRILFAYNPDDQTKEFYNNEEFYRFSQKVYKYITKNKQEKEPFTIYADKKSIIIIETSKIKEFLDTLLEKFKVKEDYEICAKVTQIANKWSKPKKLRKPRKKLDGQ